MDRISRISPKILDILGKIAVFAGFAGMGLILYLLTIGTFNVLFQPKAQPAVAPILPGLSIVPGLPTLSFLHWIVGLFIVVLVHEFAHGIYMRLHNLKIKSSGFLFFGPILGAFVEQDDKELSAAPKMKQLAVLSAGAFSNFVFAIVFLLLFIYVTDPINQELHEVTGVTVNELLDGYPVADSGIEAPFVIEGLNGHDVKNLTGFVDIMTAIKPNEIISLKTDKGVYELKTVPNPENSSLAFIGVSGFEHRIEPKASVASAYSRFFPAAISWVNMLFFLLFIFNSGIGLVNLLPLGPVDGGKMFYVLTLAITKDEKKAKKYWGYTSLFALAILFINFIPWLIKLFSFLISPILFLIP